MKNKPPADQPARTDLRLLAPQEWFSEPATPEVLFVFFPTSALIAKLRLEPEMFSKAASQFIGHAISIVVVDIPEDFPARTTDIQLFLNASGMNVSADFETKNIKAGHYLLAMTPIRANEKGATEDGRAYSTILSAIGMLCAKFGHSIAFERALELRFSTADDRQSQTSQVFENFWEPARVSQMSPEIYTKLLEKLILYCPAELKQRLRTGFRFLGNTVGKVDPLYRFANAWIALEVICGSAGKAVQALEAIAPSNIKVHARRIKDARDELFHNGVVYQMSYHEEHWMFAAMFWHLAQYYNLNSQVDLDAAYFHNFLPGSRQPEGA